MNGNGLCVDVHELTKRFGDFTAVDRVSFQIPAGSIFGFLGPNGAGKSTTIRMLLGILPPTEGSGRVLGYDIRTQAVDIRSRVGYMSQRFSLYEDLTVVENIRFFAGLFGLGRDQVEKRLQELVELCRLTDYRRDLAKVLPGGIRQRLAFAVSLVHDPDLLFLDEPTGAVDPALRRYFWDIIVGLSQTGKTVMVTSHYMDEVERCDQVCFINTGRVLAQGSPSRLKHGTIHGRLYEFLPRRRVDAMDLLGKLPQVRQSVPAGAKVRFVLSDRPEVVEQALQRENLLAGPLEEVTPTLEDVFISLALGGS